MPLGQKVEPDTPRAAGLAGSQDARPDKSTNSSSRLIRSLRGRVSHRRSD
jgi:hypothetical protein